MNPFGQCWRLKFSCIQSSVYLGWQLLDLLVAAGDMTACGEQYAMGGVYGGGDIIIAFNVHFSVIINEFRNCTTCFYSNVRYIVPGTNKILIPSVIIASPSPSPRNTPIGRRRSLGRRHHPALLRKTGSQLLSNATIMAKRKILYMNFIALTRLTRSVLSWSTNNHIGVNPVYTQIRYRGLRTFSSTEPLFVDRVTAQSPSTSEPDYILRFGSHIHKHTKDTGLGIFIYDAADGKKLWTGRRFIPVVSASEKTTNNLADYMALADGLKAITALKDTKILKSPCRVEVQTSNRIIANHLSKENKVGTKSLKPWYDLVTNLMDGLGGVVSGQIPSSECCDVKKTSELAIKEQKSCNNYLDIFKERKTKDTKDEQVQVDDNKTNKEGVSADDNMQSFAEESQSAVPTMPLISPDKVYILRFDGGSRGNPGIAGSGMVIYDSEDGSELWSGCLYLGDHRTNNEAEYMGLITGMQCALSLGVKQIVVQGDSKLVLEQIGLRWKVKSESLKRYFDEAIVLKKQFAHFETSHIERAKNGRADGLANEAMDTQSSRGFNSQ